MSRGVLCRGAVTDRQSVKVACEKQCIINVQEIFTSCPETLTFQLACSEVQSHICSLRWVCVDDRIEIDLHLAMYSLQQYVNGALTFTSGVLHEVLYRRVS